MRFKKMLNAEEVKKALADNDMRSAIPVIEELQGYILYECAIRDRIYGNFKDEDYKRRLEEERKTYAVLKVRAKNETDARKKTIEMVAEKPIRYRNRYITAADLSERPRWLKIDIQTAEASEQTGHPWWQYLLDEIEK